MDHWTATPREQSVIILSLSDFGDCMRTIFQLVFPHQKELISVEVFVLKIAGLSIRVKVDVMFAGMDGLDHIVKFVRI